MDDEKNVRLKWCDKILNKEKKYIKSLDGIVNGYMKEYFNENNEIPVPNDLKQLDPCFIFGIAEELYNWHKNVFLVALEENHYSMSGLFDVFIENEEQFYKMYVKVNYYRSTVFYLYHHYVKYFSKIRQKLQLDHYLIELMHVPVNKIWDYLHTFHDLHYCISNKLSYVEKQKLKEACKILMRVGHEVGLYNKLDLINNFRESIFNHGKLLVHDTFLSVLNGKRCKLLILVFERLIVFTEEQNKKSIDAEDSKYDIRLQIPMDKLRLQDLNDDSFVLEQLESNKIVASVHCKALYQEQCKKWLKIINQELDLQKNQI